MYSIKSLPLYSRRRPDSCPLQRCHRLGALNDSIERYGRAPLGYSKYDAQVLMSWTLLPKNAFMLLECPFCRFHHTRSTICKC